MTAPEDADLVSEVLSGNVEAFAGLVARYQSRLFWVAFKLLGNREDARDVAQEAFIRAYERLEGFDTGRRFYTWIYRITVNLAIDRLRRPKATHSVIPATLEAETESPDAGLLSRELAREVWKTLDALPARYRALLVLRDVEGLSGKAIADTMGVGHATIRWRIHRARKLFRKAWEKRTARREGGGA